MHKSERHAALDAVYPSKPKRIAPAPIRQSLWARLLRWVRL